MQAKQYTVRNIPPEVDRGLRKRAMLTGKSLNRIIIEQLSSAIQPPGSGIIGNLDWFVGANTIDDSSLKAMADDDALQKRRMRDEWQ